MQPFTYLPSRTWSWVDIDLKWRHSPRTCFLRYQSAYYPVLFRKSHPSCYFRTLTAHNKKTKTNFQKLISTPFSTCLNLSNKRILSKRCSWPLMKFLLLLPDSNSLLVKPCISILWQSLKWVGLGCVYKIHFLDPIIFLALFRLIKCWFASILCYVEIG